MFAVRDDGGFQARRTAGGLRTMPLWSEQSRAEEIIANVLAYAGMQAVEISGQVRLERWLPDLKKDGLLIGLNWSGARAQGYDLTVDDVIRNLEARRALRSARHDSNTEHGEAVAILAVQPRNADLATTHRSHG